ncbi:MAG: peptidoglycan DD-metalloendopeptidase family protein [Hyphomicrobiales bacterium]
MRSVEKSSGGFSRILKISCVVSLTTVAAGCSTGSDRLANITGSLGGSSANQASNNVSAQSPYSGTSAQKGSVSTTSLPDPTTRRYGTVADGNGVVTVANGDTLYSIARSNKVDVKELISENNMRPPYQISVGQRLRLPGSGSGSSTVASAPATTTSVTAASETHTVQNGETLYSLGRTYKISPMAIARENNLAEPYSLRVGQNVRIPGKGSSTVTSTTTSQQEETVAISTPVETTQTTAPEPKTAALPAPAERDSSKFRWPVKGRVLSSYGPKSDGSRNDGINIAVPEGTNVRASENGVVAYAGNELKGYGNLILIRHAGGWVTAYAHNKVLHVKRGDQVTRGDVIAKAGSTGTVSSPQVHFEIRKGAEAVDPMKHLSSTSLAGG